MDGRRFLLMHVNPGSGHHRASSAVAETLARVDPSASVESLDIARFTRPMVRWAISRIYLSLIHHQPDVWEYLYDNPGVHRRVHYLRSLLHRYQAGKLRRVLEETRPDLIACTQAYPCGVVADFKRQHGLRTPLVGVLTDYAPHLYWFHDAVDRYIVPSEQVRARFIARGVEAARVAVLGIPIHPRFLEPTDRLRAAGQLGVDPGRPIVLIMGGGSGFGRLREVIASLDLLPQPCQFVVVAGTNRPLLRWLERQRFRHLVRAFGYVDRIPELMDLATLLITKPGGLTSSEALARRVPMVIVNPIPGQEAYNARYLLAQGAAVQAGSPEMVRQTVRDLLDNPERLERLRARMGDLARPRAAFEAAGLLIELADQARAHAGATSDASAQPVG